MQPYYKDNEIVLYHADCREILPSLSIVNSLVLADPPYGQTSLAWDRWDGQWLRAIAPEVRSLWCFGSMRMFMDNAADFRAAGWLFSQDLVWEKQNGSSFHADRFRRVHESICHFYRGPWGTLPKYVPTTDTDVARTTRRKRRPTHMGNIDEGPYTSEDGGPLLMRSVMYHANCHGFAKNPVQKPVEIIEPLIHYGGCGDATIIVPFSGAGSELLAAKRMGRRAIGMEIDEKQCEFAAERLTTQISLASFHPSV
jgi:site-specific DNA-methyltransferase (adenine-specific)